MHIKLLTYIQALQKPIVEKYNPEKDAEFEDERGWKLISDGKFIRNYKEEENANGKHYDEILLQFELFVLAEE